MPSLPPRAVAARPTHNPRSGAACLDCLHPGAGTACMVLLTSRGWYCMPCTRGSMRITRPPSTGATSSRPVRLSYTPSANLGMGRGSVGGKGAAIGAGSKMRAHSEHGNHFQGHPCGRNNANCGPQAGPVTTGDIPAAFCPAESAGEDEASKGVLVPGGALPPGQRAPVRLRAPRGSVALAAVQLTARQRRVAAVGLLTAISDAQHERATKT